MSVVYLPVRPEGSITLCFCQVFWAADDLACKSSLSLDVNTHYYEPDWQDWVGSLNASHVMTMEFSQGTDLLGKAGGIIASPTVFRIDRQLPSGKDLGGAPISPRLLRMAKWPCRRRPMNTGKPLREHLQNAGGRWRHNCDICNVMITPGPCSNHPPSIFRRHDC